MSVSDITTNYFIERLSRPQYMHQFFEYAGDASANSYRIADVATPTVATSASFADGEVLTPTDFDLLLNLFRSSNVNIDSRQRAQILNGNYAGQLGNKLFNSLVGQIEDTLWDAMRAAAYADAGANTAAGSGQNVINPAAATLTTAHLVEAIGSLDGPGIEDMLLFAAPNADATLRNLFRDQMTGVPVESPMLGVPSQGVSIHGVPLVKSHALPKTWTVAASASAISSNVATFTVPEGHGLQVGMTITTTGASDNITSAAAITAVTATTVVAPLTAGDEATNGAATISTNASVLALVDRAKCFFAGNAVPNVREVPSARRSGADSLQAYADFGRLVIDGYVRLVLVPN